MSRVRVPEGVPYGPLVKWPKTPASHAGNMGSNPVRVTKENSAKAMWNIYGFNVKSVKDRVGAYNDEGPPVPIPNTVVKLTRADNTRRAASREDKSTPTQITAH